MEDPFKIIEDGCYLMFRFGLRVSATVTGNLQKSGEGFYFVPVEEVAAYHSLEGALHCEDVQVGDWKAGVAMRLGVSAAWNYGNDGQGCSAFRAAAARSEEADT